MKHVWGLPKNEIGGPDDTVFDELKGTPHWVASSFCLRCKKIFCEHCHGIDMFERLECYGPEGT